MDLNQFILALRARRKAFVMVAGAVIFAALAIALLLPKKYVSSTTILLDARDEQQLAPTAHATARERAGYLQTQIDLIQSTKVAKRVVRDLRYTQIPGMREQYERDTGGLGPTEDGAAGNFLKNVKPDPPGRNTTPAQYTDSNRSWRR